MTAESDNRKRCCACAEEIGAAAILCTHCGSYQNWRRHFQFSNVVLTLLVALVAVATPLVQTIDKALKEEPSLSPDLKVSYQDGQFRLVHLLISNEGERAGAVSDGFVQIDGKIFSLLTSPSGPALIPPKSTALVTYILGEPEFEYTNPDANNRCEIVLVGSRSANGEIENALMDCGLLQLIIYPPKAPVKAPDPQIQPG